MLKNSKKKLRKLGAFSLVLAQVARRAARGGSADGAVL